MSKPIAYAIYLSDDGDISYKKLYTDMEIQILGLGEDEDVEERKSYVIYGDNLHIKDHT